MRRAILIAVSLLRSSLAVTLLVAPVTSGALLPSAAVAFAQATDEPERASGNPDYGPGWSGPVNSAPPAACPAWYGAHTACIAERAVPPAFSTLDATEDAYYGQGWSGPVTSAPPGICPAWYSAHTACVPATSGADAP